MTTTNQSGSPDRERARVRSPRQGLEAAREDPHTAGIYSNCYRVISPSAEAEWHLAHPK